MVVFSLKNSHSGEVKYFAVFFEIMLTVSVQSEGNVCGVLSKKIASKGVWGNGRLPQLKLPSALAEARVRVLIFYLLKGVFVIAF